MRETPIWRRYQRFLGSDPRADVEDELTFHLEMRVEELSRRGLSPAEARAQAEREFGDTRRIGRELEEIGQERQRRTNRARWWDALRQDLRFTVRLLRRSPGFAALSIAMLGLGIGGTTALFSVIEGVLLRPLPYAQPDRLVQLWQLGEDGGTSSFSDPNFRDVAERSRSFEALAAYSSWVTPVSIDAQVSPVGVARVSEDFFDVLGVQPLLGRVFLREEQATGAPVAIVDHGFWRQQVGGETALEDQSIRIGDQVHSIVGVMPPGVAFPWGSGIWVPRDPRAVAYRTGHNWLVVGRLAPGVPPEAARRELGAIASELKARYGDDTWMSDVSVVPLHEQLVGWVRPALLILLGAAGFLLLVACANVVNLLLARATARRGELAIRQALGAGRGRLARQFLAETLVLSLAGGMLGLVIAALGVRALLALEPGRLPRVGEVGVNGVVFAFALGVSALAAVLLGLLVSSHAGERDLHGTLLDGGRSASASAGALRLRGGLITLQVAVTVVLVVGAGLLVRSFMTLAAVDPGYRTEGAILVDAYLPNSNGPADAAPTGVARDRMLATLRQLPGVASVGITNVFPLSGSGSNGMFVVLGHPDEIRSLEDYQRVTSDPSRLGYANYRVASADYFRAMNVPLVRGRLFDERDRPGAPHAAVISQSLAESRWPGEDPIGKIIQYGNMDMDLRPYTIVGVVGDIRDRGLDVEPSPTFYGNALQRDASLGPMLTFVVEPRRDSRDLVPTLQGRLREAAPDVPVRVRRIEDVFSASLAQRRFGVLLLGVFAFSALILAVAGIYGVVSYLVAQRRREWGIRLALGARPGAVLGQVVGETMLLIGGGIVLGGAVAMAGSRVLESMLYGVTTTDPTTFAGVALLLAVVAVLASYFPALRATRVDPATAMRE